MGMRTKAGQAPRHHRNDRRAYLTVTTTVDGTTHTLELFGTPGARFERFARGCFASRGIIAGTITVTTTEAAA